MPHAYTEDQLVEQPAIGLFAELGWQTVSALEETFGAAEPSPHPSPSGRWSEGEGRVALGRETTSEVVLVSRLRPALQRLNPALPPEAITLAVDELTRDRSAMSLAGANREVYLLLKEGIRVSVADHEPSPPGPSPSGRGERGEGSLSGKGGQRMERVRVIDWDNPRANDFLLVSQFSVTGPLYTRRPDLVAFVNGLPLVVVELKKPGVSARAAFDENLTSYKSDIPQLFWTNALLIASNGTDSRVGSLTADWDRFFEWKRIEREDEKRAVSLEKMIRGTCEPARLLDIVENFTVFSEHKSGLTKIIAQNHQYLGVNAAIASLLRVRGDLVKPDTLTPNPSPAGRGEKPHYRGGLPFSGLVERARELRQQQTPAEDIAWELLRDRRFQGLKFRRQHQIGDYIADLFCAEHKLDVELDGEVHKTPKVAAKDAKRDAYLRSLGFTVLRFQNQFVLKQPEAFLQQIAVALELPSPKPGAPSLDLSGHPLPVGEGRGEGKTPGSNGIGVFWQTQGSGKSYAMVFFAQKVLRKVPGNWTFVVVTDRVELDDQIARTFAACDAVSDANECHAASGAHLRQLLGENHRYVFTLIHKFQTPEVLCDRRDVVVLTDEAHRSQYDTLALNMRGALPNAMFLAFTGTPLMAGEERTREVFGDYVSIYDFQQSVEDGATVPLFYENRTPELQLVNPNLNEDIYKVIEAAELDPEQEAKLEKTLGKQYHLITRDDRLETVAKDIVKHFLGRGFAGKAMVVSIDKATALRMHDKVRKHWAAETARVKKELTRYNLGEQERAALRQRLERLHTTDMALIVSAEQNEVEKMKKLGLDIVPHRKRMNDEELDEKFKDPKDPLGLVFVCAMWLTGFDAPSCSTVYLDKPMRNHTLMQTIARANRVFPGKHSGLIVDYANVFASLEKALAIYGKGRGGATPVRDKQKLVEELRKSVDAAVVFCALHGVILPAIEQLPAASMQRLERLDDAVNAMISPDPLRKDFLGHERLVSTLYDAVKPDPAVLEFAGRVACLVAIGDAIRVRINPNPVDISKIMGKVAEVLDASISGVDMPAKPAPVMDLSKIDFDALAKRFKEAKRKNLELETLKAAIRAQLEKLIRFNKNRADYLAKFEELIESYNNGSRNIEDLFEQLLVLSRSLTEEQQRHVRENLSEAELTIFDILTRPGPELSTVERTEVKKVAHLLLERLNSLLVLNWRQKSQARAQVRLAIEDALDQGLPRTYTPDLYRQKVSSLFEHVFESYQGEGASVFTVAV